jgi:hypothetical protein
MSERFGKEFAAAIRADREHRMKEQRRQRRIFESDNRDPWPVLATLAHCLPTGELQKTLAKLPSEDRVIALQQAMIPLPSWTLFHLGQAAADLISDPELTSLPAARRNGRIAAAFGLAGQGKSVNLLIAKRAEAQRIVSEARRLEREHGNGPEFTNALANAFGWDTERAPANLRKAQGLLGCSKLPPLKVGRPRKQKSARTSVRTAS